MQHECDSAQAACKCIWQRQGMHARETHTQSVALWSSCPVQIKAVVHSAIHAIVGQAAIHAVGQAAIYAVHPAVDAVAHSVVKAVQAPSCCKAASPACTQDLTLLRTHTHRHTIEGGESSCYMVLWMRFEGLAPPENL